MNLYAVAIMTLLIVAVVGFLTVLVLILQYYTVTKKTNELKETIYLSKMECDYSMQQLKEKEQQRVTDDQIVEARERMLLDTGVMVDSDDNSGLFM